MPASLIALQILLILLPGFSAAYIVQLLALRNAQTDFDKVIEAGLYSFIIYVALAWLGHGMLPFDIVAAKPPLTEASVMWHASGLLRLASITGFFAICGAVYINLDGNALFRKLKITERTTRRSVWNDIFEKEARKVQVVQVELADGRAFSVCLLTIPTWPTIVRFILSRPRGWMRREIRSRSQGLEFC